jgi:hypothetical protein
MSCAFEFNDWQYVSFCFLNHNCILCSGDSDIVDIEEDSNPDGHPSKRRETGSPLSDVGSLSDSDVSQSANNGSALSHEFGLS